MRNFRSVDRVRLLFKPQRKRDVKVMIAYGIPGTGKTTVCGELAEKNGDSWDIPLGKDLWFDGYDGQKTVLLDDFAGRMSHISLNDCLRLLHDRVVQVPVKGSFKWWYPEYIMITTNVHPRLWYDYTTRTNSWIALTRRIHEVYWFRKEKEPCLIKMVDFFEKYVEFSKPEKYCIPEVEDDSSEEMSQ